MDTGETDTSSADGAGPGDWERRLERFWAAADETDPDGMGRRLEALLRERPADDPVSAFERASWHDFLGREVDAVPLYRAALDGGLSGPRRPQAVVQLASSLRNVGEPGAAVELLEQEPADPGAGAAAQAFLALALHDCGRHAEALAVALHALAPTLPRYGRAVGAYADELGSRPPG